MLDGARYFAEFPDEDPNGAHPLGPEALTALAAIEREISTFIASEPNAPEPSTIGRYDSRKPD